MSLNKYRSGIKKVKFHVAICAAIFTERISHKWDA